MLVVTDFDQRQWLLKSLDLSQYVCNNLERDVQLNLKNQDPVVQSIVSLTISLRHKFVKQISAKVTNTCTLLFFVEKM